VRSVDRLNGNDDGVCIAASVVFLGAVLFSCDDSMVAQLNNAAPELSAIYEQPLSPE
jgi:hypothetical protein